MGKAATTSKTRLSNTVAFEVEIVVSRYASFRCVSLSDPGWMETVGDLSPQLSCHISAAG